MIRIVDMREATTSTNAFAVWDTVRDRFIEDKWGDQVFDGVEELREGVVDPALLERVESLLPDWAYETG